MTNRNPPGYRTSCEVSKHFPTQTEELVSPSQHMLSDVNIASGSVQKPGTVECEFQSTNLWLLFFSPSMDLEQLKTTLTTPGKSSNYSYSMNLYPSSLPHVLSFLFWTMYDPRRDACHSGSRGEWAKSAQWACNFYGLCWDGLPTAWQPSNTIAEHWYPQALWTCRRNFLVLHNSDFSAFGLSAHTKHWSAVAGFRNA